MYKKRVVKKKKSRNFTVSTKNWFGRSKMIKGGSYRGKDYVKRSYKGKRVTYIDGVPKKSGYGSNIKIFNTGKNYIVTALKSKISSKGYYDKSTKTKYRSEKGWLGAGKVFKSRKGVDNFIDKYFK